MVGNFAEFGFGMNPRAKIIGNSLEDLVSRGAIYFGFGNNMALGGTVNVPLHIRGVCRKSHCSAGRSRSSSRRQSDREGEMMRAVLWCNGDTPNPELVRKLLDDATLFGIDGGADKAIAAGFEVSEVLGDLDSVDIAGWNGKSTLLSDDSSNDLAKSFVLMSERGSPKWMLSELTGVVPTISLELGRL